jgi:hypothetical protein
MVQHRMSVHTMVQLEEVCPQDRQLLQEFDHHHRGITRLNHIPLIHMRINRHINQMRALVISMIHTMNLLPPMEFLIRDHNLLGLRCRILIYCRMGRRELRMSPR